MILEDLCILFEHRQSGLPFHLPRGNALKMEEPRGGRDRRRVGDHSTVSNMRRSWETLVKTWRDDISYIYSGYARDIG